MNPDTPQRFFVSPSSFDNIGAVLDGMGDGFASFHNKAQTSEQERRLLRFLVLQPILARAASEANQAIAARQFQPGEQIFATIDRGQTSPPFVFDAAAGQGLLYFLNWSGAARLRLTVKDPSGKVHADKLGNQPPLGCEVARASSGRWLCEVSGVELPHDNFPFVLTLAAGTAAKQAVPLAPANSSGKSAEQPNRAGAKTAGTFQVPPPPPPRSPTAPAAPAAPAAPSLPPAAEIKIPPPPPPRKL